MASRIAFFVLTVLGENKLALDPFFAPSRVHHLAIEHDHESLAVRPFADTFDHYERNYQPPLSAPRPSEMTRASARGV